MGRPVTVMKSWEELRPSHISSCAARNITLWPSQLRCLCLCCKHLMEPWWMGFPKITSRLRGRRPSQELSSTSTWTSSGLVGQAWSRRERSWDTPSSSVGSPPSFTLIDDGHSRITQNHHVRAQVVLRVTTDVLYTNAAANLVPGAEVEAPPKEEPADSKLQPKSRLLFTWFFGLACWLQPPLLGFYVNCQGGSNASLKPSLLVMVAGKRKKHGGSWLQDSYGCSCRLIFYLFTLSLKLSFLDEFWDVFCSQ